MARRSMKKCTGSRSSAHCMYAYGNCAPCMLLTSGATPQAEAAGRYNLFNEPPADEGEEMQAES
jgi:hypothetical protein